MPMSDTTSPLNTALDLYPQAFTPGEDKERIREALLKTAGIPPSLIPRVLASMASAENEANAIPGMQNWQTHLPPNLEAIFEQWIKQNHINFDLNNPVPDYDMRGWWQSATGGSPSATFNVSTDLQPLFPPQFTTPYSLDFNKLSNFWQRQSGNSQTSGR